MSSYNSAEGDSFDLSDLFSDVSVTNNISADQVILDIGLFAKRH